MIPYLALPKINNPELVIDLQENSVYTSINPGFNSYLIKNRKILSDIKNTFNPIFGNNFNERIIVWLQRIDARFNNYIHTDPREYAISYIVKNGGTNVITSMHNSDSSINYSTILEEGRWHIIKTSDLHSVRNIENSRLSITISVDITINNSFLDFCKSKFVENKK